MQNEARLITTIDYLTSNSIEILKKISLWATTNESSVNFNLLDSYYDASKGLSGNGSLLDPLSIPSFKSLSQSIFGIPGSTDPRDIYWNLNFVSNGKGWVFKSYTDVNGNTSNPILTVETPSIFKNTVDLNSNFKIAYASNTNSTGAYFAVSNNSIPLFEVKGFNTNINSGSYVFISPNDELTLGKSTTSYTKKVDIYAIDEFSINLPYLGYLTGSTNKINATALSVNVKNNTIKLGDKYFTGTLSELANAIELKANPNGGILLSLDDDKTNSVFNVVSAKQSLLSPVGIIDLDLGISVDTRYSVGDLNIGSVRSTVLGNRATNVYTAAKKTIGLELKDDKDQLQSSTNKALGAWLSLASNYSATNVDGYSLDIGTRGDLKISGGKSVTITTGNELLIGITNSNGSVSEEISIKNGTVQIPNLYVPQLRNYTLSSIRYNNTYLINPALRSFAFNEYIGNISDGEYKIELTTNISQKYDDSEIYNFARTSYYTDVNDVASPTYYAVLTLEEYSQNVYRFVINQYGSDVSHEPILTVAPTKITIPVDLSLFFLRKYAGNICVQFKSSKKFLYIQFAYSNNLYTWRYRTSSGLEQLSVARISSPVFGFNAGNIFRLDTVLHDITDTCGNDQDEIWTLVEYVITENSTGAKLIYNVGSVKSANTSYYPTVKDIPDITYNGIPYVNTYNASVGDGTSGAFKLATLDEDDYCDGKVYLFTNARYVEDVILNFTYTTSTGGDERESYEGLNYIPYIPSNNTTEKVISTSYKKYLGCRVFLREYFVQPNTNNSYNIFDNNNAFKAITPYELKKQINYELLLADAVSISANNIYFNVLLNIRTGITKAVTSIAPAPKLLKVKLDTSVAFTSSVLVDGNGTDTATNVNYRIYNTFAATDSLNRYDYLTNYAVGYVNSVKKLLLVGYLNHSGAFTSTKLYSFDVTTTNIATYTTVSPTIGFDDHYVLDYIYPLSEKSFVEKKLSGHMNSNYIYVMYNTASDLYSNASRAQITVNSSTVTYVDYYADTFKSSYVDIFGYSAFNNTGVSSTIYSNLNTKYLKYYIQDHSDSTIDPNGIYNIDYKTSNLEGVYLAVSSKSTNFSANLDMKYTIGLGSNSAYGISLGLKKEDSAYTNYSEIPVVFNKNNSGNPVSFNRHGLLNYIVIDKLNNGIYDNYSLNSVVPVEALSIFSKQYSLNPDFTSIEKNNFKITRETGSVFYTSNVAVYKLEYIKSNSSHQEAWATDTFKENYASYVSNQNNSAFVSVNGLAMKKIPYSSLYNEFTDVSGVEAKMTQYLIFDAISDRVHVISTIALANAFEVKDSEIILNAMSTMLSVKNSLLNNTHEEFNSAVSILNEYGSVVSLRVDYMNTANLVRYVKDNVQNNNYLLLGLTEISSNNIKDC